MNRGSTLFLKITLFIIGLPVLILCLTVLPKIGLEALGNIQNQDSIGYLFLAILIIMYLSAIPYFSALFQAFRLLRFIDLGEAFSELSVASLKKIKQYALIISGLYLAALPLLYLVAENDDAPGLILIGFIIMTASLVIAIFAAVLHRLLRQAIEIKSENDLTV
ncbi:DUF2975 domain-containing protein [Mangrovibacillus cuniculi]|uniref:DUF2975 domain-containing protein n=1 Tax=Mangrovibacillus cuniculi TaxID=2593652 RepID=A0A7S8C928_9BACI|nr:DUF2975 domain-containing protein [Mangrovibacillus cuniculi]QPC45551.1 DUF2975 domain-containing protein [Mangrovibacillus cuniculi]